VERPIIFSSEMIRAILTGTKTQTRRVIKPQPDNVRVSPFVPSGIETVHGYELKCPYGLPGDLLWVRESFMLDGADARPIGMEWDRKVIYKANSPEYGKFYKWKSSIHMPRWASRVTLEIVGVKVEHVQDISRGDAFAEGAPDQWISQSGESRHFVPQDWYKELWDDLNFERGYGWSTNPFVWCIAFKAVKP
jgi:hypothetical protein